MAVQAITPEAASRRYISDAEIAAFQRDGAVCLRDFLAPHWIETLGTAFDALKEAGHDLTGYYDEPGQVAPADRQPRSTVVRDDNWIVSPEMHRFLFESGIAEAAAGAMQSAHAQIYEDLLIYKEPHPDQQTPWHQDEPQWPLSGHQISSVWLCLEPVTAATGALRFVAGTHRGPLHIPHVPAAQQALLAQDMHLFDGGPLPEISPDDAQGRVIVWDTQPGDIVVFHPRIIHGAFGSDPVRPRRTFSIRFLGDDVRWLTKASVFFGWLENNPMQDGDRFAGPRFPQIWPITQEQQP